MLQSARVARRDIQGLRALAVCAVVLFHAGVPGLHGGFTGVDDFFVISGFLITGQLAGELAESGGISLRRFYARRIRRLLPAAVLVLAVTVVAAAVVDSPLRDRVVNTDALSAGLYVVNYRLAWLGTDYLSANAPPSPFQHYWSLAVEEQFYLVWPALLLGAFLLGRRARRSSGLLAPAVTLGTVTVASFAWCVHLTRVSQPQAFFWLPTRAWEFGLGGLAALLSRRLAPDHRGAGLRTFLASGGLLAVVAAVVLIPSTAAYPGVTALWPVLGSAALLLGTGRPTARAPVRLLNLRPLQWLGGISYSLYLWHWPLLILAPTVLGRPLRVGEALLLSAVAVLLAAATTSLVERPVRRSRTLQLHLRRSLALGAGLTVVACLTPLIVNAATPAVSGPGAAAAAPALPGAAAGHPVTAQVQRHTAVPARHTTAATAPPADPLLARLTGLEQSVDATIARASASQHSVPSNLTPPLETAAGDKAVPFDDGCHLGYTGSTNGVCAYADTASKTTVMLVGDSHAVQWFPAMEKIATQRHLRLESLTKSICPPVILPIWQPGDGRPYYECTSWRTAILDRVRAEHPALVVLGSARHYGPEYRFTVYSKAWDAGWASMVRDLRAAGSRVLVLGPAALPSGNVPECLAEHLTDVSACARRESSAVNAAGVLGEARAVTAAGGTYTDVSSWMCARGSCPALVGSQLVYRDDNHLTTGWASYLAPLLAADLDLATNGRLPTG